MKLCIALLCFTLVGCATPVAVKPPEFPPISKGMEHKCPDLALTPKTDKLSDLLQSVTSNYGEYHKCRAAIEAWQQWYRDQKSIYEETRK